ncbi:SDR family NAD(P)-dependent oxidoreductase [Cohnella sp. AR92]|uniref:SDR family NAD(P)-dependent oxidoreductase n=1 Tax=Cohnella sp. AR92 TaxID=648716 RepID=UPI000F8DE7D9|nr:glucose 1-dehydrogenase [Cohnella sp. AR92]RUS45085.1 glucose 1-dehydrogenase [Cohnella sp. AR92]
MGRLQDKVAVITGSGSGIGKDIALTYGREGAKIVVADFDKKGMDQTVAELKERGVEVLGVQVDVTKEEDISRMFEQALAAFGTVDILVNNAGTVDRMQAAANVEDEVWNRVMDINVTSVMRGIRKALPIFLEKGHGTIVNMASISGLTGGRGGLAYTASKHAVVGMTKNVASQYGPQNIRCNAIGPAFIPTPLTLNMSNADAFGTEIATRGVGLMPRPGTTQEIANIALFLASDESSYMNGVTVAADSGWSAY